MTAHKSCFPGSLSAAQRVSSSVCRSRYSLGVGPCEPLKFQASPQSCGSYLLSLKERPSSTRACVSHRKWLHSAVPPLSPQVFHLSQAKQDMAASVLVCHQHRRQQRLHPVQNVRRLPREEVQSGPVWRETCEGAAGPGGRITSPLRLLAQGCQGQGRSLSPACPLEGPCGVRGLLYTSPLHPHQGWLPRA